jgi:hypothetical protein
VDIGKAADNPEKLRGFNTDNVFSGYAFPSDAACRLIERHIITADERGLFRNETPDYIIRRYLYVVKVNK